MSDARTHMDPTSAGLVLGNYRILHELTSGGMGTVFRAQHVLLDRPAAVKVLRRDLTTNPELVQRFVNEAKAVTACKHPGIVEVYDFGYTPEGHAFIVMEYLEGETLGRRLARQRLTEVEAAGIAQGVASALRAAHRVGVIHRDLKPDNVFVVPDPDGGADRTKVLDFGIAKLGDAPTARQNTQTGALIGTPLYMAPEQARAAGAIDHRADLYSLGCILYHMLVGRPPFLAEGAGEIIALQMFGDVVPPSQLADVTPDMDRVVLRLLEKEPARRFHTAGELVTALQRLDSRPTCQMTSTCDPSTADLVQTGDAPCLGDSPSPSTVQEPPPLAARRRSLALVAAVLGAVAIAVAIGAVISSDDGPGATTPTTPTTPTAPTTPTRGPAAVALPAAPTEPAAAPGTSSAAAPPSPAVPSPSSPSSPSAGPSAQPASAALAPSAAGAGSPAGAAATGDAPSAPGTAEPPAPHRTVEHSAHKKPGHKTDASVGPITPGSDARLPDRAIEVHRQVREVDPPRPGQHTAGGMPIETTVDIDAKPKQPPPAPKTPRSP